MVYSYRRIIRRERGIFSYAELWTGGDHLLSAASNRMSVTYQRFPLAEIQAISITTLPHWTWPQIATLAATGLLFTAAVFSQSITWVAVLLGAFTIWPFLLAIREVARGPRCRTLFHTATGAHPLPAVSRRNRVEEFLAVVTPLVEGVQGRVDRLEVTERSVAHPEETAIEQLAYNRGLRLFSFGALLVEGLFYTIRWFWPALSRKPEVTMLSIGAFFSVFAIMLTLWRRGTPLMHRDRVYLLVAVALGLEMAEATFGVVWGILSSARSTFDIGRNAALAGAVWRIPLAAVALAVELRRK